MDKQFLLGFSTALGLSIGGGALVYKANGEVIAVKKAAGIEEITGDAKGPLATKFDESGAQGVVSCARGVVSNMPPETVYCTDGKTAGFVLSDKEASDLLTEAEAKLPGLVADEIVLVKNDDGTIYVQALGAVEQK